jgi:hypothetical protein
MNRNRLGLSRHSNFAVSQPKYPPLVGTSLVHTITMTYLRNNAAERALRAVALGGKNLLFAGWDRGGESAAAVYRLIGTKI